MACPDCAARPAGTLRFSTSSRLMATPPLYSALRTFTKNSLFVGSAAGDMTSASGLHEELREIFFIIHQIASMTAAALLTTPGCLPPHRHPIARTRFGCRRPSPSSTRWRSSPWSYFKS